MLELRQLHMNLFVDCYGVEAMKPKHRYQFHIPQQAADLNMLLDCFVTEWKHHFFKQELTLTLAPRFDALANIWKECPCESVPKRNTYTWLTTTCHDTCYLFWMVSPSSKHLLYNSLMSAVGKLFNKVPRGNSTCSQNSLTKNFFIWLFCLLYLYFLSPVSFWQRSIYTLEAGWASDVFDLSRIEGVLCTQLSRRSCYFWPLHDKQYFYVCVWI